jgi:hypothetical protein
MQAATKLSESAYGHLIMARAFLPLVFLAKDSLPVDRCRRCKTNELSIGRNCVVCNHTRLRTTIYKMLFDGCMDRRPGSVQSDSIDDGLSMQGTMMRELPRAAFLP